MWSGAFSDRTYGTRGRPMLAANARSRASGKLADLRKSVGRNGDQVIDVEEMKREMQPREPAAQEDLPDFSGRWKCTEVAGNWDAYLKMVGLNPLSRSLARGMRYGKGRTVQKITGHAERRSLTVANEVLVSGITGWHNLIPTDDGMDVSDATPGQAQQAARRGLVPPSDINARAPASVENEQPSGSPPSPPLPSPSPEERRLSEQATMPRPSRSDRSGASRPLCSAKA